MENSVSNLGTGRVEERVPLYSVVPLSVPFAIGLNVSDFCNFKCAYCYHSLTPTPPSYPKDRMITWEEFVKMIDNIEGLYDAAGGVRTKIFSIIGVGEPLTHKLLPDMIKYCSEHKICDRIELTTNGSLLTHELSDKLIDAGLTRLIISLQGTSADKYKKICGYNIDFEKFVEEIRYFYENKGNCKLFLKTVDVALDDEIDKEKFFEIFSPICDTIGVESIMESFDDVDYSDLANKTSNRSRYGYKYQRRKCCDSLFMRMTIASNGEVNACACQWPPLVLGNINEKPLKEIWNKDIHKEIQIKHLSGLKDTIPKCAKCEALHSYAHPADNLDDHMEEILKRVQEK